MVMNMYKYKEALRMSYRIVGDSCTDLPENLMKDSRIRLVPLSIQIESEIIIDDESFNQADFLKKMDASKECPKSSCPSPEAFMKEFDGAEDIYVITISGALSGSYNSAELAKKLYLEEHPNKNILVIDSKSASIGQTLIAMKIMELADKGMSFAEVSKKILEFRDNLNTKFVLETLDTLRKNGRLNNITAVICSVLNIKPVMGADDGLIVKLDQARGIDKALAKMAKYISEDVKNPQDRILGIAHCNNYERALYTKQEILKLVPFKDCVIVDTRGIATLYANDGGIIAAY